MLKIFNFSNKIKFSIIVASYNYEKFIGKTLDSIMDQTYKNFEVIVVDDGSEDNSVKLVRKYAENYSNFSLYLHKNRANKGLSCTLQLALSKAKGQYICFCESDDYWTQNHLEELDKVIKNNSSVKIISNDFIPFESVTREIMDFRLMLQNTLKSGFNKINIKYLKINILPTFSAVCVKTSMIKSCNFDVKYVPAWLDWWIWRQILSVNELYYIDISLTYWRIHTSFNSNDKLIEYSKNFDDFISSNNEILLKKMNKKQKKKFIKEDNLVNILALIEKSKYFDTQYYEKTYPEYKKSGLTPFEHYFNLGWKLGFNPSEFFITNQYLDNYPDVKAIDMNPLYHYFKYGKYEGRMCFSSTNEKINVSNCEH